MIFRQPRRRLLGNVFIAVGLLLVLIAGFSIWWPQYQGDRLRAELLAEKPPAPARALLTAGTPAAVRTTARPTDKPATTGETAVQNESGLKQPATPTAEDQLAAAAAARPQSRTPAPATATAHPTVEAEPTDLPSPVPSPSVEPTATAEPSPTPVPPSPPVRIVIPDLHLDVKVEEMDWKQVKTSSGSQSEWQIPENAAGHAVNSASLGEPGNIVISGHNNIYGRVFMTISEAWGGKVERVDKVTERSHILDGRLVELYAADGQRYDYVISEFDRVQDSGVALSQRIANAQYIEPTDDTRLTITTCWPPWSNTHRLIVIAHPAQ
jgi:hypothetical protein